ncbi:MAG TPA: hypothetical protein VGI20_04415 [Rhizomicrobium sp.]|jgi:hypothetical protein
MLADKYVIQDRIDRARSTVPSRHAAAPILFAALSFLGSSVAVDAKATITIFDPPNGYDTHAPSINDGGYITGYYYDSNGVHAFIRNPDGSFEAPIAYMFGTFGNGINNFDSIVGDYLDASSVQHGFVRDSDGVITSFDPPNSVGTQALGINGRGSITGNYYDGSYVHGFVRRADGTIKTIDPIESLDTYPESINNKGSIAGYYFDRSSGASYGFVRSAGGTIQTFDPLGSENAAAFDISEGGSITGYYYVGSGVHGYIRNPDGTFEAPIDVPGADGTFPVSINRSGAIAGYFTSFDKTKHGFVRTATGRFKVFDPSGSTATYASGMNNLGSVVGIFTDDSGTFHGFLRTP